MPSQDQPRGVTLLHVTLSLLVITVVASVAIPLWFSRAEVTLENATLLLARDLRHVQDLAVLGDEELTVVFDADRDGYHVRDSSGEVVAAPLGAGRFERHYPQDAVFRGVRFATVSAGAEDSIRIDPAGMVLDAGRLVLEFRGQTRELQIDEGNGRIDFVPLE